MAVVASDFLFQPLALNVAAPVADIPVVRLSQTRPYC